jgi:hypothetical protein
MNCLDWINWRSNGFRDYTVNFRLWRNIISRTRPCDYQIIAFWYWLNYPSSDGGG